MERACLSPDKLDPFSRVKEGPKILSSTQWDQLELFHRLHWWKISSLSVNLNFAPGRSSWSPTWSPLVQTNPPNFVLSLRATSRRQGHVIYAFFPIGTPSLSWPLAQKPLNVLFSPYLSKPQSLIPVPCPYWSKPSPNWFSRHMWPG